MIVFNVIAIAELFVVLIPAALVGLAANALGFSGEPIAMGIGALSMFPVDLLIRLAMAGSDEDGHSRGPNALLRLILPGSGGHIFFLPMWLLGIAMGPLSCLGFLS